MKAGNLLHATLTQKRIYRFLIKTLLQLFLNILKFYDNESVSIILSFSIFIENLEILILIKLTVQILNN